MGPGVPPRADHPLIPARGRPDRQRRLPGAGPHRRGVLDDRSQRAGVGRAADDRRHHRGRRGGAEARPARQRPPPRGRALPALPAVARGTEARMSDSRLGRIGAWGHLDSLDIEGARAYARRVDELGYAALWVPETAAREPFALLAALAGETRRLVLGTSIVNIWGRDAQASRMGAMTLAEATGGRFAL